MYLKCKDKKATPKTAKASAGALWLKEIRSGMKSASVPLLLATTALGSLYQWPFLYWSLFKWLLGLTVLAGTSIGMLIVLVMKLHNVESIATQDELFHAVETRDLPRATKLAKLARLAKLAQLVKLTKHEARKDRATKLAKFLKHPHEVDAGRQVGPLGMISSRTPLFEAVANGHTEMVTALLEAGADPNACGVHGFGMLFSSTPLSAAVTQGSPNTVAALLAAGANPNTPMTFAMGMFASVTPLYTAGLSASRSGSTEMVAALIKAGADPNACSMAGLGMLLWGTPMEFQAVRGEWFEHVTRGTEVSKDLHDLLKRQA